MDELADVYGRHPDAVLVAGATDVGLWVTKQHRHLTTLIDVTRVAGLADIKETADGLTIGASASHRDATAALARLHPDLGELERRFASIQIRNAGTVGGNIANGSPIGDLPPALIALGATRAAAARGDAARTAARGVLPRLRQAGSRAGRIRGIRARAAPCARHALCLLQDFAPLRPGHFRGDGGVRGRLERQHDRACPHRLRRHGGDAEAGRRRPKPRSSVSRSRTRPSSAPAAPWRRIFPRSRTCARRPAIGCSPRRTCCGVSIWRPAASASRPACWSMSMNDAARSCRRTRPIRGGVTHGARPRQRRAACRGRSGLCGRHAGACRHAAPLCGDEHAPACAHRCAGRIRGARAGRRGVRADRGRHSGRERCEPVRSATIRSSPKARCNMPASRCSRSRRRRSRRRAPPPGLLASNTRTSRR